MSMNYLQTHLGYAQVIMLIRFPNAVPVEEQPASSFVA